MMNNNLKWIRLKQLLKEKEENNLSNDEFFLEMKQRGIIFVERIESGLKTDPRTLAYLKERREKRKKYSLLRKIDEKKNARLNDVLDNLNTYCFNCKNNITIQNPSVITEKKSNEIKSRIILIGECSNCKKQLKRYRGLLENG